MLSLLDELKNQSAQLTRGATAKAPVQHASCNVIARLDAPPDTRDGRLVLRATPLFDGPYTRASGPETFVVRPERVKECLDNLNKGVGSGPGSILAFGNAWRDRETGDLSVGWINTCVSAQKVKGELNHHQDRRVEQVFAQMPVLDFTNVRRAAGEPERVRWPLGQDFAEARALVGGRWQTVAFDRAWLKEKLEQAWNARAQDQVSVNLRLPVSARAVAGGGDEAGAARALEALLAADRYRWVLTRIGVGEAVETRWQPLMRGESAAEWAARLLSKAPGFDERGEPVADPETGETVQVDRFSLIEGINNDVLFDAAGRGELFVEFLPRDTAAGRQQKRSRPGQRRQGHPAIGVRRRPARGPFHLRPRSGGGLPRGAGLAAARRAHLRGGGPVPAGHRAELCARDRAQPPLAIPRRARGSRRARARRTGVGAAAGTRHRAGHPGAGRGRFRAGSAPPSTRRWRNGPCVGGDGPCETGRTVGSDGAPGAAACGRSGREAPRPARAATDERAAAPGARAGTLRPTHDGRDDRLGRTPHDGPRRQNPLDRSFRLRDHPARLRLPSGRVALVAAGDTAAHGAALAALGFRRTRQGHVVHPEPTLQFRDVRVHFPRASVRDLARETVVRVVPVAPAIPIARRNRQRRPSDPQRHAVGDQPARSAGL